jgi:4-amino-4-deoxy-L-arabinose transferase-like glycosyltransferase
LKEKHAITLKDFLARSGREFAIFVFICVVGLAIRFPFFFPAVIDWDESTFIIVGQSAVNGFLPYEIAWELKPPVVFWWFGAAIELFGKTIPAVRCAGFIWLALSAYVLYRAAFSISDSRLGGILAAAMLIVASSTYSPHVSTELLAVLPMSGAILLLQDSGQNLRSVFMAGILLGLACMFRLNLIFLCFAIGVFLSIQAPFWPWKAFLYGGLKKGVSFSVGVLTPAVLSFLPYLLTGHWQLWTRFYEVAVSYSDEQRSVAKNIVHTLRESNHSLAGATMWGAAVLGALILYRHWSDLSAERRSDWVLCGVFVLGSFFSIIMTGPLYPHYFTQLAPGLSMFAAAPFMSRVKTFDISKANYAKFVFGSVLIATVIFRAAGAEWSTLTNRLRAGEPLSHGAAYDIADFIRSHDGRLESVSLFMLDNHLVYWILDRYPPTLLATQPSLLSKPFIRKYLEPDSKTTEDALRNVFLMEPTFVVGYPRSWYLDNDAYRFLQEELATAYELVANVDGNQVFQRKGTH